jgi:hypothetical protein
LGCGGFHVFLPSSVAGFRREDSGVGLIRDFRLISAVPSNFH